VGYEACHVNREGGGHAGGVALYVAKHIHSQEVLRIVKWNSVLTVQCRLLSVKLNITVAYNPKEANTPPFLYDFEKALKECQGKSLILGDFNLNLLKPANNTLDYNLILGSYGYDIVNKTLPLRLKSLTLLDHVTRNFNEGVSVYNICSDTTDHNLLICHVDIRSNCKKLSSGTVVSDNYDSINDYMANNP